MASIQSHATLRCKNAAAQSSGTLRSDLVNTDDCCNPALAFPGGYSCIAQGFRADDLPTRVQLTFLGFLCRVLAHEGTAAPIRVSVKLVCLLQELRTLILINCGATEDVAKLLELDTTVRIIVIDNHRPFHHNFNDPNNLDVLAFCNPEDGTCSGVPDPDGYSGVPNQQTQRSKAAQSTSWAA